MTLFSITRCLLNRHAPNRQRVKWDGARYIGKCKRCGRNIARKSRGKWRLGSAELEAQVADKQTR